MPHHYSFSAHRALVLTLPLLLLAWCASLVDTPNQRVQVLTPGATGAKCEITSQYTLYKAYPPETVFMRRGKDPLRVTCIAPGNREKTIMVYPTLNPNATGNFATGGLSGVYDHFSGALYDYPDPIVVDFRSGVATPRPLPQYHAPDTVSPFDVRPETLDIFVA
jgi:hypothetical protein